jgi:hypothetical protein
MMNLDERSFQLGVIAAFAELVGIGMKPVGFSHPMDPQHAEALFEDARTITERNGAQLFCEKEFIVTPLFPESATEGKHVLVIHSPESKVAYDALHAERDSLEPEERARRLGRLLGYPEETIDRMLKS